MKRIKKYSIWVLCVLLFCVIGVMPIQAASVKKVTLNKKSAVIYVGKTVKLKAKVTPTGASNAKIKWSSSKKSVASVKNGVVKGLKPGKTTITAKTANGKKATCKVTVKKLIKPTSVQLSRTEWQMNVGETYTLTATVLPTNATVKTVKWYSSNSSVVKVKNGKLTARKKGTATITVKTANGKKAKCKIKVVKSGAVNVMSGDTFMKSVAAMTKKAAKEGTSGMAVTATGYSRRLIVKSKGSKLDFSSYNPEKVAASLDDIYFVQFASSSAAKKCFSSLSNDSRVEYVEYDDYVAVDTTVDTSLSKGSDSKSWGVDVIYADDFANFVSRKTSSAITVAVIDTGVASNHSFLSGRVLSGGYDLVDGDYVANDGNGHGTHVSGTVVDCTPGLKVNILPIRVLDDDGRGTNGNVANGVYYAVRKGAKVINLSLNGGVSNYLDDAIRYAVNQGVTVVCAAGNDNSNTVYSSPAHLSEAIVVAACDSSSQRAYFSNYGTSVDVIAPGVDVISCIPGGSYQRMSGTSMASPHVAGLAAMVKLLYPSYTPSQIESFIKKYTTDLGSRGYDTYYGYGRPNMSKALAVLDKPGSISLSSSGTSGTSITLTATTYPAGQAVTWSSSNSAVAKVSNGKVTAVAAGTATITAKMTYNGKTYSANKTVTVNKANSYGSWSGWSLTPVSATSTREVQYTPMYRYYGFVCSSCGASDPFYGSCGTCGANMPVGTWQETWSSISYANSGYAKWSGVAKCYTWNLGDGRRWNFSSGNLYHTAVGTLDSAESGAVVIQQGYRYRTIYTTTQISAVY